MASVKGCHLVGSVPLPDTEAVFRQLTTGLPDRLKRIPDGETGARYYFTLWQGAVFNAYPPSMAKFVDNSLLVDDEFTDEQIEEGLTKLKESGLKTGYDTAAIESYAVFKKLRDDGVIPAGVKFQVSIPTASNVITPFVQRAFQKPIYPVYEASLFDAIKNIQASIPHEDLSIQYDLAVDTAFWEGVYLQPWFEGEADVKEFVLDYITRMLALVEQDVEVGFHNCYGDMEHKHWHEPTSLKAVCDRGLAILERTPHKIAYFHAPVAVSAMEFLDDYLKPLETFYPKLKEQGGELILGVVQYDDLEGTKKRIDAASKYASEFSIATECGMGRTPKEQVENILQLSTELSKPVN